MKTQVCVVGSGPAGAVTAAKLVEAGRDVIVVEEGPRIAAQTFIPYSLEQMRAQYRDRGNTVAIGAPRIVYAEGRCVGGGGEINSRVHHRTPPEILDEWRERFELREATPADLEPRFREIERVLEPFMEPLATDGKAGTIPGLLAAGARELGWKTREAPKCRLTSSETFLAEALARGGRILPDTRVTRVSREGGSGWTLKAVRSRDEALTIEAETVFFCAGAIQTPATLRRSGIRLNVGNSLQMHPTLKMTAEFAEPVNSLLPEVSGQQVSEFSPRMSFGCSVSTLPQLAVGLHGHDLARQTLRERARHMAIYYAMIRPGARGKIRALPGTLSPWVLFQLSRPDRENLRLASERLSELLRTAGASAIYPGDMPISLHLFSSCPMGENRKLAATDSFGKLHGFDGLYVNDASLLCSAPGVNPQGSILAFALRNTLRFLGRA